MTKHQVDLVLKGCHTDELGGGHFGRDKTYVKGSERYYWVGILDEVSRFCRTCDNCKEPTSKCLHISETIIVDL